MQVYPEKNHFFHNLTDANDVETFRYVKDTRRHILRKKNFQQN